jgi:hypothetical protein
MSLDVNALVVVTPLTITDAMLLASGSPPETNVPENDYPEWVGGSPAVTYAEGDRVILTSTHKIYESLQDGNTDRDPRINPTWWIEVGPTNRWALFDNSVSTQTAQATNITYTLEPGVSVNALAALNITDATELRIRMESSALGSPVLVYNEIISFANFPIFSDWYSFFFGTRQVPTQHIALDLPSYSDAIITIELDGGPDLAIGVLMLGQQARFGRGIRLGTRVGIQDYSRKETNEFGDTVLVQRAFAKRANFDLFVDSSEIDPLQAYLSTIRATPVLWIGSTSFESTTLFGFYKNFEILIAYPEHAECELEIEGLT